MSDHFVADGSFINSIVGEGTEFRGDLKLNGLLRIDGDFTGSITTDGKILIGKNGRAECTIKAGTVVVGGIVRGNISSTEKVIVLSTGMVIGNISTPRLIVEEGVVLNGKCVISKNSNDVEGASSTDEDTKDKPVTELNDNYSSAAGVQTSEKAAGALDSQQEREEFTSWNR